MHNAESGDGDRMSRSSGVGAGGAGGGGGWGWVVPLRPQSQQVRLWLPGVCFNPATFDAVTV